MLSGILERLLENKKSPARKLGQIDNRGSHFYLALYWAHELSIQSDDQDLKSKFQMVFTSLDANQLQIAEQFLNVQGSKVDINGYYYPDEKLVETAMRPSKELNSILSSLL